MTTEQLKKAKQIMELIDEVSKQSLSLRGTASGPINFTQTVSENNIPNVNIKTPLISPVDGYQRDIHTILNATKQTLLSIYERELQRLKKEFEAI